MALDDARILLLCDAIVDEINSEIDPNSEFGVDAVRGYSLGFTTSELSALRIVVRPDDYGGEEANPSEINQTYKIEIGVLKNTTKANIDPYLNLVIAIDRLFPINLDFEIDTNEFVQVTDKRFMPLYFKNPDTLDSEKPTVRFESRLHLEFTERGRAKSEAT